jgi:hypothetical protein
VPQITGRVKNSSVCTSTHNQSIHSSSYETQMELRESCGMSGVSVGLLVACKSRDPWVRMPPIRTAKSSIKKTGGRGPRTQLLQPSPSISQGIMQTVLLHLLTCASPYFTWNHSMLIPEPAWPTAFPALLSVSLGCTAPRDELRRAL